MPLLLHNPHQLTTYNVFKLTKPLFTPSAPRIVNRVPSKLNKTKPSQQQITTTQDPTQNGC